MNPQNPADPAVFEDTDKITINITETDLLGTHTYEDVLYTGETNVVNAQTGETPDMLDKTVQEATNFASQTTNDDDPPRVVKAQSGERTIETRVPYVPAVFYHMNMTGGLDWHTVFQRAWESDTYTVKYTADYTTGTLTITVTETTDENTA